MEDFENDVESLDSYEGALEDADDDENDDGAIDSVDDIANWIEDIEDQGEDVDDTEDEEEGGIEDIDDSIDDNAGWSSGSIDFESDKRKKKRDTTSDAECQVCQWAVSAVEAYISQPDTEQELARVLQELCTVLPGNYAQVCQNFVVVYMDETVAYVIDNFTPPVVCSKLDVCVAPPVNR